MQQNGVRGRVNVSGVGSSQIRSASALLSRIEQSLVARPGRRQTLSSAAQFNSDGYRSADGIIELVIFWAFIAGLSWTPFWYGSNDLISWGINAILFPGLASLYEVSLFLRGAPHPIAIKKLGLAAALFGLVVVWILVQTATWVPAPFDHPIWELAAKALGAPLAGSVSVNRELTTLALVRLMTTGSVFWIAVQLCRNSLRASRLIEAVAAIGATYAVYGLITFAINSGHWPGLAASSRNVFLSSTFINRNSFATFAGICLLAICGLIFRLYRHEITNGPPRHRIAAIIEATGQRGVVLLSGGFLILVALLLTGSRGGIIAAVGGFFVLSVLTLWRDTLQFKTMAFVGIIVATVCVGFGGPLAEALAQKGLGDAGRLAVYSITLQSIIDVPLTGFGYGTFVDVFPMYRDRSISLIGVWEQAHNTYLEVFQGLGLVFGLILVFSVALLAVSCGAGAIRRRENSTIPCVAASVVFLVAAHALVDFSLQIQAVTVTFAAILGTGVAQAQSSRSLLED
jgi:O-antigen ligase